MEQKLLHTGSVVLTKGSNMKKMSLWIVVCAVMSLSWSSRMVLAGVMQSQDEVCSEEIVSLCCESDSKDGEVTTGQKPSGGKGSSTGQKPDGLPGRETMTAARDKIPGIGLQSNLMPEIEIPEANFPGADKKPRIGKVQFPKQEESTETGSSLRQEREYTFAVAFDVVERDSTNIIGGNNVTNPEFPNPDCEGSCEGSFILSVLNENENTIASMTCDYTNSKTSSRDLFCISPLVGDLTDTANLKIEATGALSAQAYNVMLVIYNQDLSYFKSYLLDIGGNNYMDGEELACLYTRDSGVVPGEVDTYRSYSDDTGSGTQYDYLTYTDEVFECDRYKTEIDVSDKTYGYKKKIVYPVE